jgi:hypothetical protein
LPSKCQHRITGSRVYLYSLMAAEHDSRGHAECAGEIINKVNIVEALNPCVRGFRVLKIMPKT